MRCANFGTLIKKIIVYYIIICNQYKICLAFGIYKVSQYLNLKIDK